MERVAMQDRVEDQRYKELENQNLRLIWEQILRIRMPREVSLLPRISDDQRESARQLGLRNFERQLGSGAFSKVYKSVHQQSHEAEAVKVVEKKEAKTLRQAEDMCSLIVREIHTLTELPE